VFSNEAVSAKVYDDSVANVMPVIEKALAVNCLCEPLRNLQQQLAPVKTKIEQAGSAHQYEDALKLMDVGRQYANSILHLAANWTDYAEEEEKAQAIIGTALGLKVTKNDQVQQQKSVRTGQETAAKEALKGNIANARKTLATAVTTAQTLI